MNKPILTFFFLLCCLGLQAQVNDSTTRRRPDGYKNFRQNAMEQYESFKNQAQSEFEQFLAEAWTEYHRFAGTNSIYSKSKPETIPANNLNAGSDAADAGFSVQDWNLPMTNDEAPTTPGQVKISFYGCPLSFSVPEALRVSVNGTREANVARCYESMRKSGKTRILADELDTKVFQMGLNEWGYFTLLRAIAEKTFTDMNDRVMFCFYMLHSHGFKARIGRGQKSKQLMLLLAIDNSKEVYSLSFFRFNGVKHYAVYGGQEGEDVYSYNEKADQRSGKELMLDFKQPLHMAPCNKVRQLRWNKDGATLALPYSTTHLRYYDDMPLTQFPVYAGTALPPEAQQVMDSAVNALRQHLNERQIMEVLLHFVQNAFSYKIDEKQFGREKYFFPEEVIGYPFSDCEDRAALFASLLRRYTHYELVGLVYSDHMAVGVCFDDGKQPEGLSFVHKGKTYVMCDPTYTNAPIGKVMPQFSNAHFEIIEMPK